MNLRILLNLWVLTAKNHPSKFVITYITCIQKLNLNFKIRVNRFMFFLLFLEFSLIQERICRFYFLAFVLLCWPFAVPACPYLIIIYENVAGKVRKVAYILWFNYFCQIEKETVLSLNSKRIFHLKSRHLAKIEFSNFSCVFLNTNIFFRSEF